MANNEIVNYLNSKYSSYTDPNNYDKFVAMLKSVKNKTDRESLIMGVPFINPKYRGNIDKFLKDHEDYQKSFKPVKTVSVKVPEQEYKNSMKRWKANRTRSSRLWNEWKKTKEAKKAKADDKFQKVSSRKLKQLQRQYKARVEDKPTKYIKKKVKETKKVVQKVRPSFFYDSDSRKLKWVSDALSDSRQIIRSVTPIKHIRNLLSAHRMLVEHGVEITKGIVGDEVHVELIESYLDLSKAMNFIYWDQIEPIEIEIEKSIDELFFDGYFEKAETGTWSERLRDENRPSRWVTLHGNKVLIKLNPDNTATIIYSKNKSLEHLRITKKKGKDQEKLIQALKRDKKKGDEPEEKDESKKEETKKVDNKKRVSESEKVKKMSDEERADYVQKREKKHKVKLLQKNVKEKERIETAKTLGVDLKELGKVDHVIDAPTTSFIDSAEKKVEEEKRVSTSLKKINDYLTENVEDKKELNHIKKVVENELKQKARDKVVNVPSRELIGEETVDNIQYSTGHDEVDKILAQTEMSDKQALQLLKTEAEVRDANSAIRKTIMKEKDFDKAMDISMKDIDMPKGFDKEEVVEKIKEQKSDEERAKINTEFYNKLHNLEAEDREKGGERVKRLHNSYLEGASETYRSIGLEYLDGKTVDKDLLKQFAGIEGIEVGAKMMASAINEKFKGKPEKLKQFKKDLKTFLEQNAVEAVDKSLDKSRDAVGMIGEFDELVAKGTYHETSLRLQRAKQLSIARKNLVTNAGSLTALSELVNQLNNPEERATLEMPKTSEGKAKYLLNKNEVKGAKVELAKGTKNKYNLDVPMDQMHKFMKEEKKIPPDEVLNQIDEMSGKQIDKAIDDLKSGKDDLSKWKPEGVPDTFHDVLDDKSLQEARSKGNIVKETKKSIVVNEDGKKVTYEKFENKVGEAGYRRDYKEGATLYRAEKSFDLQPSQKRMVKFLKMNKRAIWNAQAGIGKTLSTYSAISDIKSSDKDFKYALYNMPKDLVGEATKDVDKFMPHLKVATIDKKDSPQKIKAILQDAQAGKYDVVLAGHHTTNNAKTLDMIKAHQPSMMVTDEAHQVFGKKRRGGNDDPTKSSAMVKKMIDLQRDSKHVVNMTGTVVNESMDELAKMAVSTRPDLIDEPEEFIKRYSDVNQGTTVFNDQIVNDFRQALHRVMINEKFDVGKVDQKTGDFKKTELRNLSKVNPKGTDDTNIKMTDHQAQRTKEIEDAYQKERKAKGWFLVDKQTRMPILDKSGNLTKTGYRSRSKKQTDKNNHLQKMGHDHTKYDMERAGQDSAYTRKQKRHSMNVRNGDHNTNAKFIELKKNIEMHDKRNPNEKHVIHFNSKDTKRTLNAMLNEMGYTRKNIATLDTSQKKAVQERQKIAFMNDPDVKFIIGDQAMSTGQNLQKGGVAHIIEAPETHSKKLQQIARNHRRGSEKFRDTSYLHEYYTTSPIDQSTKATLSQQESMMGAVDDYERSKGLKQVFKKQQKEEAKKKEASKAKRKMKREAMKDVA